jgi:hypothetical protein
VRETAKQLFKQRDGPIKFNPLRTPLWDRGQPFDPKRAGFSLKDISSLATDTRLKSLAPDMLKIYRVFLILCTTTPVCLLWSVR